MKNRQKNEKSQHQHGVQRFSSSARQNRRKTTFNFPITFVTTLSFLLGLNKELLQFEAPLTQLLETALIIEKIYPSSSKVLLKIPLVRRQLKDCQLELDDLLTHNEVAPDREDAVHHAIICILKMLVCQ
jgi:hypothetical protein